MAIDTSPSQVATSALSAIPFGSIIGGPLKACIEAQAMAAQASWNFIKEVGLNTNAETGEKEAINVTFRFLKDGRMAQLNVPLLTIVPIPYIAITDIDIAFKANISASSSSVSENSSSSSMDAGVNGTAGLKVGPFHVDASFNANYSSKKDSKATQESKYSVEYTMDVAVKAGQESMPAGMAKLLELLGNALSVDDPKGTLEVSSKNLITDGNGTAQLIVTYKNSKGLYEPEAITIGEEKGTIDGNNKLFDLKAQETAYVVKAGDQEVKVIVSKSSDTNTGGKQNDATA